MKARFLAMIEREAEHARAGRPAQMIIKVNSLEDHGIIRALYQASQAGVEIDLLVRGLCCLRPGIKDLSERIRVVSIVGRLLEHSRIFYFRNGAADPLDGEYYIGSADWMYRNLLSRVEVVTPILDRRLRERCREILTIILADQVQAWEMQPDGTYRRRTPPEGAVGTHATLMRIARDRSNQYLKRLEENRAETLTPAALLLEG
jgi:polyphosphate kinase